MNCSKIKDKEKCETVLDTKGLRSCRYRYNQKSRSGECEDLPEEYRLRATRALGLMSGIAKEQKEDEIYTDIQKLFSKHSTVLQEPYLSNMAQLISAVKNLKRGDWVYVNEYIISKNKDKIVAKKYYGGGNVNLDTFERLIFFIKKILCGKNVLLRWFYQIGRKNGSKYPIDQKVLKEIQEDEYINFFKKITKMDWSIKNLTELHDSKKLDGVISNISVLYLEQYINIIQEISDVSSEGENISILNYIKTYSLGESIPLLDRPNIENYFCNTAKKTTQYLRKFIEWSLKKGTVYDIDFDLEEKKAAIPKYKTSIKNNFLEELFTQKNNNYYADYLMKRYDDPNYGPIAAAMIVEAAVVRDIPLSYLERSLFEIKRKIQTIHDELLPTYTGKQLPLYVDIFYEYQRRNFSETCSAYSYETYNFIADNYLFGGCNCECGVYLLTYIKSLYPDDNWDYYSLLVPGHIFGIIINKNTGVIYKLETTDLINKLGYIIKLSYADIDTIGLTFSSYNNALGLFCISVTGVNYPKFNEVLTKRIQDQSKLDKIFMITVIFWYKRYMRRDISDHVKIVTDLRKYLEPEMIMRLISSIINRDGNTYKNMLDVLWVYMCILLFKIYFLESDLSNHNEEEQIDITNRMKVFIKCRNTVIRMSQKYYQKYFLNN